MSEQGNGLEMESVIIDGKDYPVRTEVADEIVNLRRGTVHAILDRIRAIAPSKEETVIVIVPANVSQEFQMQVGQLAKQSFPDNGIAVLPEGLDMHTQEGVKELLEKGMEVAIAVQDNNPERARGKAEAFVEYVQGRADTEEAADAGE